MHFSGSTYCYVPIFFVGFAMYFYAAYIGWGIYGLKGKKRYPKRYSVILCNSDAVIDSSFTLSQ